MRPDEYDLSEQFKKFAGREVIATEQTSTRHYKHLGITHTSTHVTLDDNDPAIKELTEAVKAAGLTLRLWLPETFGTMDFREDRLNVNVDKAADGKYRIGNRFTIG